MTATTCRSGRHPISERYTEPSGHAFCGECRQETKRWRNRTRPGAGLGWSDPTADRDRADRLANWRAGVDIAIARVRLTEGFDGTRHPWRTLGECLLPASAPAMVALLARRRAEERLAS